MSLQNFGGNWTEQKLECIKDYLSAYTTALKNQSFKLLYIDAFAGTGYRTLQSASPEKQLKIDQVASDEQFIFDGSAKIALDSEPPFDEYIFVEKDPKKYAELCLLKYEYPGKEIIITQNDANEFIKDCCKSWHWNRRAVLFLDPFGLAVDWTTIEHIAQTKSIDLWLLFPLGSVMRMLPNDTKISDAWRQKLTRFFGESTWYERFYSNSTETIEQLTFLPTSDTQVVKTANYTSITNYFVERLKTVFPEKGVVETPMILYNSMQRPIFLLCFAASNPKGATIAKRIAESTLKSTQRG